MMLMDLEETCNLLPFPFLKEKAKHYIYTVCPNNIMHYWKFCTNFSLWCSVHFLSPCIVYFWMLFKTFPLVPDFFWTLCISFFFFFLKILCFQNQFQLLLVFRKTDRKQEAQSHTLWEEVERTVWIVEYSGGLQGRPSSSETTPPSSPFFMEIAAGGEPSRIACFSCICTANINRKKNQIPKKFIMRLVITAKKIHYTWYIIDYECDTL